MYHSNGQLNAISLRPSCPFKFITNFIDFEGMKCRWNLIKLDRNEGREMWQQCALTKIVVINSGFVDYSFLGILWNIYYLVGQLDAISPGFSYSKQAHYLFYKRRRNKMLIEAWSNTNMNLGQQVRQRRTQVCKLCKCLMICLYFGSNNRKYIIKLVLL